MAVGSQVLISGWSRLLVWVHPVIFLGRTRRPLGPRPHGCQLRLRYCLVLLSCCPPSFVCAIFGRTGFFAPFAA